MQSGTNKRRERRRAAWLGAWTSTGFQLLAAFVLLGLSHTFQLEGFLKLLSWGVVLADLAMIVPVWLSLRQRLNEIEGGEEDAAAQY